MRRVQRIAGNALIIASLVGLVALGATIVFPEAASSTPDGTITIRLPWTTTQGGQPGQAANAAGQNQPPAADQIAPYDERSAQSRTS
jgi:hypothetical protein